MYDYEAGMTQCQNEIRRLRSVVRFDEEKIERLKTLLYNAVTYIEESIGGAEEKGTEEQKRWYEETLGITDEELSEIGIDWFENGESEGE